MKGLATRLAWYSVVLENVPDTWDNVSSVVKISLTR
jgi:hypothetical protein